jgi:hypothetical protein
VTDTTALIANSMGPSIGVFRGKMERSRQGAVKRGDARPTSGPKTAGIFGVMPDASKTQRIQDVLTHLADMAPSSAKRCRLAWFRPAWFRPARLMPKTMP